jgi:hypothetical protein
VPDFLTLGMVFGLLAALLLTELVAAIAPVLIVVFFVPPDERPALAAVIAAADSRPRLRVWRALRVAVVARRAERSRESIAA